MAGVSDLAFRELCVEQGAHLTYSEMVSAKALSFSNDKTYSLLVCAPNEAQIVIQIFGHEPDVMAVQAQKISCLLGDKLAYIDINMGCPARKIVKKGDGSALMKNPRLAAEIISAVSSSVEVPVTAKIRRGFEMGSDTALKFAQRMEAAGASALAVHGRYAEQLYRGKADWHIIADIKQSLSIPVIGNGDLESAEDVIQMKKITDCDAYMIGRAARVNPWIFMQAQAALEGKEIPSAPSLQERLDFARSHAQLLQSQGKGEIVRMRKHAMCYVAGLPGASLARGKFSQCNSYADFNCVFNELQSYE